jgi:hypothetical protein
VEKYDVSDFSYQLEIREFLRDLGDDQLPVFKRVEVIDALAGILGSGFEGEDELSEEIA